MKPPLCQHLTYPTTTLRGKQNNAPSANEEMELDVKVLAQVYKGYDGLSHSLNKGPSNASPFFCFNPHFHSWTK